MKEKKICSILDKSMKKRCVITGYIGKDKVYYNFVVLDRSDELVLAARDLDFQIDGYMIFEIKKINKLMDLEYKTDKYNQIMQAEGVLEGLEIPSVNLKSLAHVFNDFQKANRLISMTVANNDHGYYIGTIEKVKEKSILFSHFDAEGEWYGPDKLKWKDIELIQFGDRYARTFSKYVPDKKSNSSSRKQK